MHSLIEYELLVADIDQRCREILDRFENQINCVRGCKGNCCRIHLSISAVEAYRLSIALGAYPRHRRTKIQASAARATTAGPCPLLDRGACSMYADRLLLCRTHGLPMRHRYRGISSVGCCQKNFRQLPAIPDDACIDLDRLNIRLAAINRRFLSEYWRRPSLKQRYLIGEALLLGFHSPGRCDRDRVHS
jgi:hypothetical protein